MTVKSRREQIAEARRLGLTVQPVRRTGEMRFISPFDNEPPVTINNRRKDGTRAVEAMLRRHAPDDATPPQKEAPPVVARATQTTAPKPVDVARAFVHGRTTEEVIREMAREKGADLRLRFLVERLDRRVIKRDPPPATCSATCEWCARHPFTPHPLTAKGKAS